MKKILLFVACALVLASCTKDKQGFTPLQTNGDPYQITFESPIVAPTVKGAYVVANNGVYPTTWNFKVSAVQTSGDFVSWGDATSKTYMDEVEVAYAPVSKTWDPAAVAGGYSYYWPKNGKLTFQAYSPASWDADMTATGINAMNTTIATNLTQADLMYANLAINKTANDYKYAEDGQNGVQIVFNHALSSVLFNVKKAAAYTGTTITVKSITLENVDNAGSFNQDIVSATPEWTPAGNNVNYDNVITVDGGVVVANTTPTLLESNVAADLLVMPQTFFALPENWEAMTEEQKASYKDNNAAKFVVVYTIKSATGTAIEQTKEIYLNDLTYTLPNSDEILTVNGFEVGKQYTFTLTFTLDEILFAPTVSNWTEIVAK